MIHASIECPPGVGVDAVDGAPPPDGRAEAASLAGLLRSGRWSHATMRASSRHAILHVSRGAGRIVMGGLRHGYSAGDAALVPAGVMHAIDLPRGVQGTLFHVPATMIPEAPRGPRHGRTPGSAAVAEAAAMAAELAAEIRTDRPGRARGIACRAGILALWIERESLPPPRLRPEEALSRDFAAQVEARLESGRGAADHARMLGVDAAELDAACRAVMGRGAEDVVTERLIHEALRLIRRTTRPLEEIAARLGLGTAARLAHLLGSRCGLDAEALRRG